MKDKLNTKDQQKDELIPLIPVDYRKERPVFSF